MPNLSEFLSSSAEEGYGLVCDVFDFVPHPRVKRASFLVAAAGQPIDRDILDVVIAYRTAGVDVAIEVAAGANCSAAEVLSIASSLDVSICLLPPADARDSYGWHGELAEFVTAYAGAAAFTRSLAPVTDVLRLRIAEMLSGQPGDLAIGGDPWTARFLDVVEVEARPGVVDAVKAAFDAAYGGSAEFEEHFLQQVRGLYDGSEEILLRRVEAHIAGQAPAA